MRVSSGYSGVSLWSTSRTYSKRSSRNLCRGRNHLRNIPRSRRSRGTLLLCKYTEIKPREAVYSRLDKFWKTEILPLRKTDATVLIVSHGGIISVMRKYLLGLNYRFHKSLVKETNDFWEVRNCSITEIVLGD